MAKSDTTTNGVRSEPPGKYNAQMPDCETSEERLDLMRESIWRAQGVVRCVAAAEKDQSSAVANALQVVDDLLDEAIERSNAVLDEKQVQS